MVDIVILTHAGLADGFVSALDMLFRSHDGVVPVGLKDGETLPEFMQRVNAALDGLPCEHGCLILCDLFGGTPCNVASAYVVSHTDKGKDIACIAGISLPMLVEAFSMSSDASAEAISNHLMDIYQANVVDVGARLAERPIAI